LGEEVSAALVECRGLRIEVPGRVLVDELDLAVPAGEFLALLGGNGTGKSLLLRTLAGLRPPARGIISVHGSNIAGLPRRDIARQLGFLPQDPEGVPQGAVEESLLLGRFAHLGFWETASAGDRERVSTALTQVGLAGFALRELASLSGGEQRRAAIARLLVQEPSIYLLDEPTNHLDPAQQIGVLQTLHALTRQGAAAVVSLHEPNLALRFADRVALLSGSGAVQVLDVKMLETSHLESLYGLRYGETRIGSQRLMAPD
jgi:iron complex transport system ATP-binding protein